MEIKTRQSNFSQFSEDLWLTVDIDNLSIDCDISESDIKSFVIGLLDICEIALYKQNSDNSECESKIREVIEELENK